MLVKSNMESRVVYNYACNLKENQRSIVITRTELISHSHEKSRIQVITLGSHHPKRDWWDDYYHFFRFNNSFVGCWNWSPSKCSYYTCCPGSLSDLHNSLTVFDAPAGSWGLFSRVTGMMINSKVRNDTKKSEIVKTLFMKLLLMASTVS